MKKIISILAIAVVSISFTSCRQDDVTSDMDTMTKQEGTSLRKANNSVETATADVQTAKRPVDPDPPVKDGTRW